MQGGGRILDRSGFNWSSDSKLIGGAFCRDSWETIFLATLYVWAYSKYDFVLSKYMKVLHG